MRIADLGVGPLPTQPQSGQATRLTGVEVLQEGGTSALQEAEDWLRELLATGATPVKEIIAAAAEAGITERTLRRAREKICQRPHKVADHWVWDLAEDPRGPTNPLGCLHLAPIYPGSLTSSRAFTIMAYALCKISAGGCAS